MRTEYCVQRILLVLRYMHTVAADSGWFQSERIPVAKLDPASHSRVSSTCLVLFRAYSCT